MKKFQNVLIIMAVLTVICIIVPKQEVYAAKSRYINLKVPEKVNKSKTYKKYDVTGDGVADKVTLKITKGKDKYDRTLKIKVNGLSVYKHTAQDSQFWDVNLVCLKNGKVYFEIYSLVSSEDIELHELYQYKNGTLKRVFDFQDYGGGYVTHYFVSIKKVSGNTIYTNASAQFLTTGGFLEYKMKLKYSKGKIKRVTNTYKLKYDGENMKNHWTVNRKIKVYKKPGSSSLIYTLKKGDVIKINKVIYKNKKVYFEVKNKNGQGKKGYIRGTKTYPNKLYFKESWYSG